MSIRVLFFLPDLGGGGAQRTIINIVNNIERYGKRVVLAVAHEEGPAQAWISEAVDIRYFRLRRTVSALAPLRHLIRQEAFDVVFSTMVHGNIIASAAVFGMIKPPKLILRETNSHRAREDLQWLQRKMIGWAYKRADAIVSLSSGIAIELIHDYDLDEKRIYTVGNPVDVISIFEHAKTIREASERLNPENTPLIVAIGRLTKQKGFDTLLLAIAKAKSRPKLIIIGEGNDRQYLEKKIQELKISNRVDMPGFLSDPVKVLAHADIFVLSSRWEGFGHVIVEAMAAGVPVISTRCPHGPADIIVDGHNGKFVPVDDSFALAEAIDELWINDSMRKKLAERALVTAQHFSFEVIVSRYNEIISSVLDEI